MNLKGLIVFQASIDAFRTTTFFKQDGPEKLIELFNEGEFNPVALFPQDTSMDAIFERTQNIDRAWTENSGLREIDTTSRKRSTSVGDVIVDTVKRKAYAVSGIGFTELDAEKLALDDQIGQAKNLIQKDMRRDHRLGKSLGR